MLPPSHLSKVADDIRFSNVAHCDEFQNGGNRVKERRLCARI